MQPEFRHARTGSLTIGPNGQSQQSQQQQQQQGQGQGHGPHGAQDTASPMAGAQARFDGPRSPPNTAHVPCKFFRQGACQAGNSCPFSHDIGTAIETVCKYFAKGNCKFGPKCANMHLLPDGRRVTYGKNGVIIGTAPLGLGNRINPAAYMQPSNSALTNSFLNAGQQQQQQGSQQQQQGTPQQQHEFDEFSPDPTSAYGSPPGAGFDNDHLHSHSHSHSLSQNHNSSTSSLGQALRQAQSSSQSQGGQTPTQQHRSMLGLSPMNANVLSVLDAPLPASFDSNGISHAARYGPWPSSVPSKFGLESPSASLHNAKDERTSETLKLLHTSAFGDHLSPSHLGSRAALHSSRHPLDHASSANLAALLSGSTSATAPGNGNTGADDFGGKRIMHSSSSRYAKPRLLSSSAPKVDRDWDTEFWFLEEDYVPANLANEVLTPQEKARRGSIRLTEPSGSAGILEGSYADTPTHPLSASASANATKFGSPAAGAAAGSPSRWSPWLQQRQRSSGALPSSSFVDDDFEPGSVGRSMKHAVSAFGHVGSPLRNSSLSANVENGRLNGNGSLSNNNGFGSNNNGTDAFGHSLSGSLGGRPSSFGFGTSGGEPMSMLSQQLQRTRLGSESATPDEKKAGESERRPSGSAVAVPRMRPSRPSTSLSTAAVTATAAAGIIGSSGSPHHNSSSGRFPAPIDEEDPSLLFDMEEVVDEDVKSKKAAASAAASKSASATTTNSAATATPATNSLWGYANAVKGASNGVEQASR
ncbi:hypothetical protein SBRCBS47491_008237 [Sporothrix bragantina]|uniref:C3H1-type domain-containing protein n=1 Tax=Sporothrix bragantina TaxID=671064 RepID=A0ABP0CJT0_9PEZI